MSSEPFPDVADPTRRLEPPGSYGEQVEQATHEALGALRYIDEILQHFTGRSYFTEFQHWLGGDWGRLLSLRDAWHCLAFASLDVQDNLVSGQRILADHWCGGAAVAFDAYMDRWAVALEQNHAACLKVRDLLTDLAEHAKHCMDLVIQTVRTILSLLALAAVSFEVPAWGQISTARAVWKTIVLINDVRMVVGAFVNVAAEVKCYLEVLITRVPDTSPDLRVDVPPAPNGAAARRDV